MRQAPPELLAPRSIAIIGASDDATKTAARPLRYLRQGGFMGTVYPIARRDTVLGERAWPSLSSLPARPDHAFVLLPTEDATAAVAECVRLAVPIVTVLASGFSEAGPHGVAREAALKELVRGSGTRLLGPNSIGLVSLQRNMVLTANAAFAETGLPCGGLFVASQSGSMIGALLSRGKARGIGFSGFVSVGSEADLGVGEVCAATLDDPETDAYLLFLETIGDAAAIRKFAIEAAARGRPVLAYKLGRSQAAAELALSHTGALAGEDDVADAFFRDCGIARLNTLEGLLEAPALLRRLQVRTTSCRKPVVGVVTTTGGGAAMVVDQLGVRGIDVEGPCNDTHAKLTAAGIEAGCGRIIDLTLAGTRYEIMKAALDVLIAAPEFDLVVPVVGSSARFQPEVAVLPVVECAGNASPIATFLVPEAPEALLALTSAGVPVFRTPEACADAIAAGLSRRQPRTELIITSDCKTDDGSTLDEAEAYALLDRVGVPHAPFVRVPVTSTAPIAIQVGYPVAAKVLHRDIAHKTDVGGVVLGIASATELQDAVTRIGAAVAKHLPHVVVEDILVQPMVRGIGEVLVGYRVDPQVGPIVILAAGGVLTEIYRDRSVRIAPVDLDTAWNMIREVRGLKVLDGYRGQAKGDLNAVANAIVRISQLASLTDTTVLEFEVNPLVVLEDGNGVIAVDALARIVGNHKLDRKPPP